MHEVAIVEALLDSVQEQLRQSGVSGRVRKIEVVIGKLSGVVPDAFRFAFDVLAPEVFGTPCELLIEEVPAVCLCRNCGEESTLEDLVFFCPRCGHPEITIQGGRELLLQSIELEEPAAESDGSIREAGG